MLLVVGMGVFFCLRCLCSAKELGGSALYLMFAVVNLTLPGTGMEPVQLDCVVYSSNWVKPSAV